MFKKTLITFLAVAIILCGNVPGLWAQSQVDQGALSRILGPEDDSRTLPGKLKKTLEQLEQETAKLRATIETKPTEGGTEQIEFENDDSDSAHEIRQSIDLMRKIFDNKRNETEISNLANTAGDQLKQLSLDPTPQAHPLVSEMMNFGVDSAGDAKYTTKAKEETAIMAADRVLPQPVNVFEMGNSLFQTGNLAAALAAYEVVDRTKITEFDSIWLDYMTACCNRRLGNEKEAEGVYREIANEKKLQNPVASASWWLDYMQTTRDAKTSFHRLDAEIELLLERAESHVKK